MAEADQMMYENKRKRKEEKNWEIFLSMLKWNGNFLLEKVAKQKENTVTILSEIVTERYVQ